MTHQFKRQVATLRTAHYLTERTQDPKTLTRESRQSPINRESFGQVRATRTRVNQHPSGTAAYRQEKINNQ
ncbi:hypothetical protein PGT21_030676 [Puccinia graminis f. sp. tritici]|uniref:Uncharacterized protein n=1 Tax=Puccinia graminis f. sp. tritici TaxID=56615 RepID=A0A5B0M501_PUCGR|nr:hypothetical protein PGT21_030676 [Puccinia graminis f. sp. tritici]